MPKISASNIFTLFFAAALLAIASAKSCSTTSKYLCPLCGGISVSSCNECDGYLNVGKETHETLIHSSAWNHQSANSKSRSDKYFQFFRSFVQFVRPTYCSQELCLCTGHWTLPNKKTMILPLDVFISIYFPFSTF